MSSSGVKRSANSPLSDNEEKRHRVLGDSIVDDPDATIINSSFSAHYSAGRSGSHHVRCR